MERKKFKLRSLQWPDTLLRRFLLAIAVYFPTCAVGTVIVSAIRGLSLETTLVEVVPMVLLIAFFIALFQAWLAKPKTNFWRPLS